MSDWPELSVERDHETLAILHLASQMLGKIRVAHAPWVNHGWHVGASAECARPPDLADGGERRPHFHADARPLPPCDRAVGQRRQSREELPLNAGSIAALHRRLIAMLDRHGLAVRASMAGRTRSRTRSPLPRTPRRATTTAIPPNDSAESLAAMLPVFAALPRRLHRQVEPGPFLVGQLRPGRQPLLRPGAPQHPGGIPGLPDRITREAYSHEVSSGGFWAGGVTPAEPFFYSYIYPEPDGLSRGQGRARPLRRDLRRIRLALCRGAGAPAIPRYDAQRVPPSRPTRPRADLAKWDRAALEREPVAP